MRTPLNRRDFLKFGAATFLAPFARPKTVIRRSQAFANERPKIGIGRITVDLLPIRAAPQFGAEILRWELRDELLDLEGIKIDEASPTHNQRWYQLDEGYIYSGYVQRVGYRPQKPAGYIPADGQLIEVMVPYSRAFQVARLGWTPIYRLYFGSVHWATGMVLGPKNSIWYQILDERLNIPYVIPAEHARVVDLAELKPLSSDVPADEKKIVVSIADQTLMIYEADKLVLTTRVSTGLHQDQVAEGEIPTDTPTGNHLVDHKRPARHVGHGRVTSELDAFELPGVPWVSYFYSLTGVAFHGTYWHDNFGKPLSHGCVNMRTEQAKWIFRWTMPHYSPTERYVRARGTSVQVI